jgi:hypothetical protein
MVVLSVGRHFLFVDQLEAFDVLDRSGKIADAASQLEHEKALWSKAGRVSTERERITTPIENLSQSLELRAECGDLPVF